LKNDIGWATPTLRRSLARREVERPGKTVAILKDSKQKVFIFPVSLVSPVSPVSLCLSPAAYTSFLAPFFICMPTPSKRKRMA
jgi:hypothetical protein